MTLGELTEKTMKILEEYSQGSVRQTTDADYRAKFIGATNDIVSEVSKICAILKSEEYEQETIGTHTLPNDCRTVTAVFADGKPCYYDMYGNTIIVKAKGDIEIRYDATGPRYTDETADSEVLPFPDEVCGILPYGICKMILLGVGEYNTATEYEQKYYTLLQEIKKTANMCKVKVVNLYGAN